MPRVSFTMSSTDHVGGRLSSSANPSIRYACARLVAAALRFCCLSIIHLGICGRGRAPLSSPSRPARFASTSLPGCLGADCTNTAVKAACGRYHCVCRHDRPGGLFPPGRSGARLDQSIPKELPCNMLRELTAGYAAAPTMAWCRAAGFTPGYYPHR
jgi:hypothetical protein